MSSLFGENSDRTSSRVIRPPGGAHSDIFGLQDGSEQKHHIKYNQPKSTISEVFTYDTDSKKTDENDKAIEIEKEIDEKNENEAPKSNATPQRPRVPPGGFSSALW